MKERNVYDIDLIELLALCIAKWKQILAVILLAAIGAVLYEFVTFQAPPSDAALYRKIENVILSRRIIEEKIASAQTDFEENQFYTMDPDTIVTKRLTLSVELSDQSGITDQIDPTDMVLYAYHNMARTDLRGDVLVPDPLTRLQREQLLSLGYDTTANTMTVTMTSDDEALIDTVMATAVAWYTDVQEEITRQTRAHKLTVLPVSVTTYTRKDAEEMVSTVAAETNIRSLENRVMEFNTTLDALFNLPEDTAVTMTVEELEEKFSEKKENESAPKLRKALLLGGFLGAFAAFLCVVPMHLIRGRIYGDDRIGHMTGWYRLGRLNVIPPSRDPGRVIANRMLYHRWTADGDALATETRDMTAMLLGDAGLPSGAVVALVGDASDQAMAGVAACLSPLGFALGTSPLLLDRVGANRLCRRADAVIFVGRTGAVSVAEVHAMEEIAAYTGKAPVGYIMA